MLLPARNDQNPAAPGKSTPTPKKLPIRRHADQEEFVDQPHEDPNSVRVAGPFTVESLSPHRVLGYEEQPVSEEVGEDGAPFASTVLENLRKAGRREHCQGGAPRFRLARAVRRHLGPPARGVHRRGRCEPVRRCVDRSRARHDWRRAGQGGGQGGAQGRRRGPAPRLRPSPSTHMPARSPRNSSPTLAAGGRSRPRRSESAGCRCCSCG